MNSWLKELENPFLYDEKLYPEEFSDLGLEKFIFHRELEKVKKALGEFESSGNRPLWLIFSAGTSRAIEIDFFSLVFRYFLNSTSPRYFASLIRFDFLIQDAPTNLLRLIATRMTPEIWRRSFYFFLKNSLEKLEQEGNLKEALPEAEKIKEILSDGEEKIDELLFPLEPEDEEEELALSLRDFSLRMIDRENLGRVVKRLTEATFIWQSWEEGVKQFQSDIFLPHQAREGLKGLFELVSSGYKPVLMFTGLEGFLTSLDEETQASLGGFLVEIESLLRKNCYFIYETLEENLSQVELLKRGKEMKISFWPLSDLPLDSVEKAKRLVNEQLSAFLPLDLKSENLVDERAIEIAFKKERDPQSFLTLLGKAWQKAVELGKESISLELLDEASK